MSIRPFSTLTAPPPDDPVQDVAHDVGSTFHNFWHFDLVRVGNTNVQVNQVVLALAIFIIGAWISSRVTRMVVKRVLARRRVNPNVAPAIEKIVFYLLLVISTLTALEAVNIPMTLFTVLGGALAIGVGFGAQNLFNNFLSGLILMFEGDIRIGDMLEVENWVGHVAEIGSRRTRIKREDGVDILVPNSTLLQNTVVNWTLSDNRARASVKVGVAYGSPVRRVAELLGEAAAEQKQVLKEPGPVVVFKDFGDSTLNFEVFFWAEIQTMIQLWGIQSEVRFRIEELCRENKIEIPFPQRDVRLDAAKPVEIKIVRRS